jgi:hypothetical protein
VDAEACLPQLAQLIPGGRGVDEVADVAERAPLAGARTGGGVRGSAGTASAAVADVGDASAVLV